MNFSGTNRLICDQRIELNCLRVRGDLPMVARLGSSADTSRQSGGKRPTMWSRRAKGSHSALCGKGHSWRSY